LTVVSYSTIVPAKAAFSTFDYIWLRLTTAAKQDAHFSCGSGVKTSQFPSLGEQRRPPSAGSVTVLAPLRSTKVLDQVRERVRLLHYSRRTEEAYVHWSRAFIRFHGIRHPALMGQVEVGA
jgi:Phage integrase, N-terminal SAM-like domain